MDIKNIILRLNNDIQLNYGTREIFCQKNGFDYKSMTAMFSRVLSKNQNPRIVPLIIKRSKEQEK